MQQLSSRAEPLDTTAAVESPEHVRFHYHVAGPAKRALAYVIDLLIRVGLIFVLFAIGMMGNFFGSGDLANASIGLGLIVVFVVEWGYYIFWETLWSGRTPGKRAMRLRVVTEGGYPLHFADSLLRNLLRAADFLPSAYALGLVVMGRDPRFRRLGDLVAGTMVIVEQRYLVSPPLRIVPPPTPEELRHFPPRPPLSGDDLEAIELFLRRAPGLSTARAAELAELVVPVYARKMGLKPPRTNPQRFLALLYHHVQSQRH
jgi:uncharacterized RDD family membrane protein YckC